MHEDLQTIVQMWENLHRTDQLKKERGARVEHKRHCGEILEAATARQTSTQADLDRIRANERQVMRKLDSYRKRIKTTRVMIDTGKAPDYRLAARQLESCIEIADDLETQALELWEQREEAEEALQQASDARADAQQALESATTNVEKRSPAIRTELAALAQSLPALEKAVPSAHKGAIRMLRSRGRSLVSQMHNGSCTLCNYAASQQSVNEIEGHHRVHQCRNCQRFILPESSN